MFDCYDTLQNIEIKFLLSVFLTELIPNKELIRRHFFFAFSLLYRRPSLKCLNVSSKMPKSSLQKMFKKVEKSHFSNALGLMAWRTGMIKSKQKIRKTRKKRKNQIVSCLQKRTRLWLEEYQNQYQFRTNERIPSNFGRISV